MAILTETFEGSPEGMNVSLSAQELPDTQARYIQDSLVDYPGTTRRRGPVRKVAGSFEFSNKVSGIAQTLDPAGSNRVAVINGDNSNGFFNTLNDTFSSVVNSFDMTGVWDIDLSTSPPSNPYKIVDIKQARGGGILMGISDKYSPTTNQVLGLWRGSRYGSYSTGTITANVNSKTVTGSGTTWTTNVEPGAQLFTDGTPRQWLGTVKSVDSNTGITLEQPSLQTVAGAAYATYPLRGIVAKVMKGRITCTTTAATVTGAGTKFIDQKVKNPSGDTWKVYRLSDYTYVGDVTSVQSNTALTLTGNAAVNMSNERFVAVNANQHWGSKLNLTSTNGAFSKVGFLSAVYAERQWYANLGAGLDTSSRLWFSDPLDLEGLDLAEVDGDFINVGTARGSSSPIRALQAAYNGLIIAKEDEVYILRGTTPSTFSVSKLHDDGVLSGMSTASYAGGVLWAGRNGINFYDGVQVENITLPKLGDYYKNLVRAFDPSSYRMWAMVVRDHYFLFIEAAEPNVPVIKGNSSVTPTQICIAIYMPTRAVTVHTNLNLRGAVTLPADTGENVWYIVNGWPTTLSNHGPATGAPTGFTPETLLSDRMTMTFMATGTDGWIPRLQAYLDGNGAGAGGTAKVRLALYANSGGSPTTLIAESDPVEIGANAAGQWYNFDLPIPARQAAGSYWIGLITDSGWVRIWKQTHTGFSVSTLNSYTVGFPGTVGVITGTERDRDYSMIVSQANTSTLKGYICDAGELFDTEAPDDIGCDSGKAGPDFYYESKKFSAGDSLRKKLFKQLAIHYQVLDSYLKLDTSTGLNLSGITSGSRFPPAGITWDELDNLYPTWSSLGQAFATWNAIVTGRFVPKRIKFLKRSTHLSFRLYQSSLLASRVRLGPFQVGYKLQRPGRI